MGEDFFANRYFREQGYHTNPQSTSPLVWAEIFLNGLICAICETSLIRRCWKVHLIQTRYPSLTPYTQVTKKNKWVTPPLAFLLVTIFIANVYLVRVYQNACSSRIDWEQSIVLGLDSKHGRANDSVSNRWVF